MFRRGFQGLGRVLKEHHGIRLQSPMVLYLGWKCGCRVSGCCKGGEGVKITDGAPAFVSSSR